jgi:hypothetical protein
MYASKDVHGIMSEKPYDLGCCLLFLELFLASGFLCSLAFLFLLFGGFFQRILCGSRVFPSGSARSITVISRKKEMERKGGSYAGGFSTGTDSCGSDMAVVSMKTQPVTCRGCSLTLA